MDARGKPDWDDVESYAIKRIESLRGDLEKAPKDDLDRLQAEIKAWRALLKLPKILTAPTAQTTHGMS